MPTNSVLPVANPPKSHLLPLLIVLLLVASGTLYYYLRVTYPSSAAQSPLSEAPSSEAQTPLSGATPSKPPYTLPQGPQTYRFSHGKDVTGPKIQVVTIDPLDPKIGSTQTITLEIESPTPLKSAEITLTSDNQEKTLDLKLKSGDSLKGTYTGSWQVDDTFDIKYSVRYLLLSANDKFDNTMYIR